MAKLKAPLFSFGASGQIAKSLVYFPWKGLDVVRQHVVPANPKSGAQVIQRGYVSDAVAGIHAAMSDASNPLNDVDKSAFSLQGSNQPTPRTWFNTLIKTIVDQLVAGGYWAIFSDCSVTPGTDKLTCQGFLTADDGVHTPTSGKLYYGTSKSALLNSIVCSVADYATGKDITSLTTGVKYYVQYRIDTAGDFVGCNMGIYSGTPT